MNRTVYITVGIVLIIFIFLVWLFLFINGAPANTRDVFSDLGIVEQVERTVDLQADNQIGEGNSVLNLNDGELQQITTGPVAGFTTASTSEGKQTLRYMERGTGYIFEINLNSGLQTQVTPNTLPGASEAYFGPNMKSVVVVSEVSGRLITLIKIQNNEDAPIEQVNLDSAAENIEFLDENTIAYTKNSFTETTGYLYDIDSNTVSKRLSLSIPDAIVFTSENNKIYTYPKPTNLFLGNLYEYENDELLPVGSPGKSLVPFIDGGVGIVTYVDNNQLASYQLPTYVKLPYVMLPEKCVSLNGVGKIWCGTPSNQLDGQFIENWYKGVISSNDSLWEFNTKDRSAVKQFNPLEDSGRQIDVTHMNIDQTGKRLLFINKIDSTLWLFNLGV